MSAVWNSVGILLSVNGLRVNIQFAYVFYVPIDSWPVACIHGDKSQPERDWVLNGKFLSFHTSSVECVTVWCGLLGVSDL